MDNLTTTISPLVIDIVLAAIILLVACLKAKAGLFQSVMSVVVIILALAIGLVGSKMLLEPVTQYAWEKYEPKISAKFDEEVEAALSGERSLAQVLKDSWNRIITNFDVEELNALIIKDSEDDTNYADQEIVAKLKVITLAKGRLMCEKVTHLALFGVLTAVGLLLLTLLKNLLDKVANFSVVGWVNHLGGFVLGFIEIVVIMLIIIRGAGMINIPVFDNMQEGTVLMKWFVGGDIQSTLTSIENLTLEDIKNIKLEDLTTVDFNDVGAQLKDIINNIDTSKLPDEVNEAIDKIDTEQISEDVKDIIDSVDVEKITDKATDAVKDTAGGFFKNLFKNIFGKDSPQE